MRAFTGALALTAVLVFGGCTQPELPSDAYYRLQVPQPPERAERVLAGTLEVARPRVEGVVAERALVYAEADMPNRFYQYSYHHWAEPPARMLQDELVDYLRAAGVAGMIAVPEQRAAADHVLSTRLRGLEQVRGEGGHVHLLIEFTLRSATDGALLWTREMRSRRPTDDNSLQAAVTAFEEAFGEAFAELVRALAGRV